jgi:hypothetical protein
MMGTKELRRPKNCGDRWHSTILSIPPAAIYALINIRTQSEKTFN